MKTIVCLAFIVVVTAADKKHYTTLNDHLDVDAVFANDAELRSFLDCFKNIKPCTDVANSYKVLIVDAVQTACSKCNPAQMLMARKFIEGLEKKQPKEYEILKKIYDPENKYFDAFRKAVLGH